MNTTLLARIEFLEAENCDLNKKEQTESTPFRVEQIQHDDKLVRFYTGFISLSVLLALFVFLGPAVDQLCYWGSKDGQQKRRRTPNLLPLNQFSLKLVKL